MIIIETLRKTFFSKICQRIKTTLVSDNMRCQIFVVVFKSLEICGFSTP